MSVHYFLVLHKPPLTDSLCSNDISEQMTLGKSLPQTEPLWLPDELDLMSFVW